MARSRNSKRPRAELVAVAGALEACAALLQEEEEAPAGATNEEGGVSPKRARPPPIRPPADARASDQEECRIVPVVLLRVPRDEPPVV